MTDTGGHSVFSYDAQGRAVGTELKATPDTSVGSHRVTYTDMPAWTVLETYEQPVLYRDFYFRAPERLTLLSPTQAQSTLTGTNLAGSPRLLSQDQVAGSGCAASTSAIGYDAAGNPARIDDFNGNRTCHAYDSLNRETVRVEGLSSSASCETLLQPSAVLPAGARKVSTAWHPLWRLPAEVSEPGRRTRYIYNHREDPYSSSGNAVLTCTGAGTPTLPNFTHPAVLCKQVEEATTDTDGHLGAAAPLDPSVPRRVRTWTYNERGQVLTARGPRTDVDDTVTYTYYTDATADHAVGDLKSMALPQQPPTVFTKYDAGGQLLESRDPNSVVTTRTYDARQRLWSITVGNETTRYDYWPTGLLQRVTQPDASWQFYEYDDAHRLRKVLDNRGNSVTYTLDAVGNRTAEEVKDPGNVLRRSLGRAIDALGRVQQVTGRE